MSRFIEAAACRGRRPSDLVARVQHARSELIARLLKERRVARFLVAPDGFGKTSLAYAYAEVVFSFEHVFWINARSPCFLRDLDAGSMADDIGRFDGAPSLVIYEDLPRLAPDRAAVFSGLVDTLLERGYEVLVTCAPSCDVYGKHHQDRLLLTGRDLLLTEEEARIALKGEHSGSSSAPIPPVERIACLRWKENGAIDLARGILQEELPCDFQLAMLSMLVLQKGSMEDLRAFWPAGPGRTAEVADVLAAGYPYLGVDVADGTFETASLQVEAVGVAFSASLEGIVRSSAFESRDELAGRMADRLVARGKHDRALEVALALGTKLGCGVWITRRGWRLLAEAGALSLRNAYAAIERSSLKDRPVCNSIAAWAAFQLDDAAGAHALAKRVLGHHAALPSDKMLAAVLLLRTSSDAKAVKARDELSELVAVGDERVDAEGPFGNGGEGASAARMRGSLRNPWLDEEALGKLTLALHESPAKGLETWTKLFDELEAMESELGSAGEDGRTAPLENALLLSSSWIFAMLTDGKARAVNSSGVVYRSSSSYDSDDLEGLDGLRASRVSGERAGKRSMSSTGSMGSAGGSGVAAGAQPDCEEMTFSVMGLCRVARSVVRVLDRKLAEGGRLGWCELRAYDELDCASRVLPHLGGFFPGSAALAALRGLEVYVLGQREEYRKICEQRDRQVEEYYETRPSAFRNDARTAAVTTSSTRTAPPSLHVSLFGSFEVRRGEEVVDSELLRKQKIQQLLAILVLARGREVTRDKLAQALWPGSGIRSARKSLYTVWKQLAKVLAVDGSCPYLVRDQYGCRINPHLVVSDVTGFESLCRQLLFGRAEGIEWEQLYAQVEDDFADDLLPYEMDNEHIVALRDKYHTQLVDALLSAAQRLMRVGETQGALWFAREALRRDSAREDVYATLMEAQIAAGQRSSALNTFFACTRFLSEQLGIDPSSRIVSLYQSVIEADGAYEAALR